MINSKKNKTTTKQTPTQTKIVKSKNKTKAAQANKYQQSET